MAEGVRCAILTHFRSPGRTFFWVNSARASAGSATIVSLGSWEMNEKTRNIWEWDDGDGPRCFCVVNVPALHSRAGGRRGFGRAAGRGEELLQRGGDAVRRHLLHALSRAK